MKTTMWNVFDGLKTEEEIQAFVEASIEEAENDTDPSLLAHALGVAAKARGMLSISREAGIDRAGAAENMPERKRSCVPAYKP